MSINLKAKEDHMKVSTAAFYGALLGGCFALWFWPERGGIDIVETFMKAIAILAIPVGAICGAAFAALINWMDKGPSG